MNARCLSAETSILCMHSGPAESHDDVDQAIDRMQAPEQIVVLPIGAREERREMGKANAAQTLDAVEAAERAARPAG